jgi:TolA-binding protein
MEQAADETKAADVAAKIAELEQQLSTAAVRITSLSEANRRLETSLMLAKVTASRPLPQVAKVAPEPQASDVATQCEPLPAPKHRDANPTTDAELRACGVPMPPPVKPAPTPQPAYSVAYVPDNRSGEEKLAAAKASVRQS